jgi:hypothetical protein
VGGETDRSEESVEFVKHHAETHRRVLVLGDYRQTVTIVRSLGRAGFRIVLGTDERRSSTALSRYVSEVRVFEESSHDLFLDQLETYLRREKPDYVFPVGETEARRIAGATKRFMPLATWVMPDPATVLRCFDKRALYELTPTLGIPTASWREYTDFENWSRVACEMGFPVVVKRKDSSALIKQKKAIILRTPEAFDRFLVELQSEPDTGSLVLQKFVPGERQNCHIAADRGRIVAFFQQKVLRTNELDGTGIGVEGVSVALPYRLGYDYPRIAVEIAAHDAPAPLTKPYPTGKHYHWLYGDAQSWLDCRKHRRQNGAELLHWALRMLWRTLTSHHLTWDVRDPIPTLHHFWKKLLRPS